MLLGGKLISAEGRANLDLYRYGSSDDSLITPYMQSFWNFTCSLVPMWVAPNLLTLGGLLCMLLQYVVLACYCWDINGVSPPWVQFLCSACVFMYQTLDAIDGKQARRTNSSSALGELFDHGCDAVTCCTIPFCVANLLQFGPGWHAFGCVLLSYVPFYIAAWEEFHTLALYLAPISVNESMCMIYVLHFYAAIYGNAVFVNPVQTTLGVDYPHLPNPCLNNVTLAAFLVVVALTIFKNVYNVIQRVHPKGSSHTPQRSLWLLTPLLVLTGASLTWAYYSPGDILHTHGRGFLTLVGFLATYNSLQAIVGRLTQVPWTVWQISLLPLIIAAINAVYSHSTKSAGVIPEAQFVYIYCVAIVLAILHYGIKIIGEFCDHLKISAFRIKLKK